MIPHVRPRFRTDLVAEAIEDAGHRYIDVADPDTGSAFRFYEVEYSLACAMDGERDVSGLVQWAREELGIEPSANELTTVIGTLGQLGYLAPGTGLPAVAGGVEPALAEPVLAAGVVAPALHHEPAPADVELGAAGGMAPPAQPLPVESYELGTAGPGAVLPINTPTVGGPELGPAGYDIGPPGIEPPETVIEFEAPTPPPPEMPVAHMRPSGGPPDLEDDGPTNLPPASAGDFEDDEVSVDLSDHLAISASDVQEAVRASKVMRAVDLPPELADQLDAAEASAPAATADEVALAAEQEAAARAAREAHAAREAEAARADQAAREAEARAAQAAAPPAVELPQPPVGVSRPRPTRPSDRPAERPATPVSAREPAPAQRGTSKVLIVLFILVVLLAAAFVVWTRVLHKPLPWETAQETQPSGPAEGSGLPVKPTPPPPPPPPSATLAESPGPSVDLAAGQTGSVAFVIDDGATVAAGDTLVRFTGSRYDETKLAELEYDIETRVPKQLAAAAAKKEKAEAAGDARGAARQAEYIEKRTEALARKQRDRDEILEKMAGLIVKAPSPGTVAIKTTKGARVGEAEEVVATITAPPLLTATFEVPSDRTFTADQSVGLAVKSTPTQQATCKVSMVAGTQVTVECPLDAGLAAGTDVILR